VGGFSICDILSCLFTCGLILKKSDSHLSESNEGKLSTDFRKRFEHSMDKERRAIEAAARGEVRKVKQAKDVKNYLSQNARQKNIYNHNGIEN
jgi:hypothetical protein